MFKLFLIVCSLCCFCLSAGANGTIALLPLDSRPANTYSPYMVAKMAGFELLMPEPVLLDYYKKPGNCEQNISWLQQTEADFYIISVSQLCYGGLVASRTGAVSIQEAQKRLESLRELRKTTNGKPIYVFDTIQRLAITSSDSRAASYYSSVHNWAILKDEVENLGQEDKRAELERLEKSIPADILTDYLKARARNHIINQTLIDMVKEGVIDYLILAQDDASVTGLHRAERESLKEKVLELNLTDKVNIFPGADEVGVVLVSRAITKYLGIKPSFGIFYRGIDGNIWVAPFEDISFAENIRRHIAASGATLSPQGLVNLFVATPGGDNQAFTRSMQAKLEADKKVVVCDVAITNRADPAFFLAMINDLELKSLSGYAGWNTAGNTLGFALGQGIAAIAREGLTGTKRLEAEKAHYEYLLHRIAKDYYYKNYVQGAIESWASGRGFNTINLPEYSLPLVKEELMKLLLPYLFELYVHHFANEKAGEFTLPPAINWDIDLAWPRFFEIAIKPVVDLTVEDSLQP